MYSHLAGRLAPVFTLVLTAFALAGCGGDLGAEPQARPAAAGSSVSRVAAGAASCGSYERPCALDEIRVSVAAE